MLRLLNKSIHHNLATPKDKKIYKSLVDYTQRGQYRSSIDLKIGDKINNFEVTHSYKLPDYQMNSFVLKCSNFGTEWIHFDCEEEKNSFTMTTKCRNVPLLVKMGLEKMLQCGSKKFPVRNPIQHMMRRSFNPQNFSMTTGDYIFYGYQTTLLKDHYNLMEVFLNMMYNPLLREEDFKDIVWRFQMNQEKNLQIAGQLTNEMRNLQNLSQMKIFDAIQKHLLGKDGFPKPEQISNLTYSNFVDWHQKIFSPKNLLIISHGDIHPINIVKKFTEITEKFKWSEKYLLNKGISQQQQQKQNQSSPLQQSKTIFIEHFDRKVPFFLSFKLQNLTTQQRILLSILSMIIFDMPNSRMMKWLTPQTPYPKHYGFQGNYFNIGVHVQLSEKPIEQRDFIELQKSIRGELQELVNKKISNFQIQQCLMQLQGQYYAQDGIKLINGCLDNFIQGGPESIPESLNVKLFISNILKRYRKQNIFENLLKKFILQNQKYIRICGKYNEHLIEDAQLKQKIKLRQIKNKLKDEDLKDISSYRPASILQDYRILPNINITQFQIFEQKNSTIFPINGIPVYHKQKCDGLKITLKYDITDIDQNQVKLIPVVCASYPWMGTKGLPTQTFNNYVNLYIKKMDMRFETMRTSQGMKLYLFFSIEFSDRNSEFGFNLVKNLINQHNDKNYEMLSEAIQKKASENYNALSENLIEIHGMHVGASRSPYAMMEDPLFMSRSVCGLASDIQKISNSKQILQQVSYEMKKILDKFKQKNRIQILFQCRKSSLQRHQKYLQTCLNPLNSLAPKLQHITDISYTPTPFQKYFPNYSQQFVFQAFSVPYYTNLQQSPIAMVLATLIGENIKRYNPDGGCFAFKGSLVSYIRGGRKKVIELQQYYRRLDEVQEAKRVLFQKFRRYTAADLFYTGVKVDQARIFKQSIAMVDQPSLEACLQKYILSTIKQGKSSILSLGPNLGSYEPLIKKGWIVERSIEDMSLNMESASPAIPHIETSKYINIY